MSVVRRNNSYVTKLSQDMEISDKFCCVEDTSLFPDTGYLRIGGSETIYYDGKTPIVFDDLTRGLRGSIRKKHKKGDLVIYTEPFNPAKDTLNEVLSWIGEDIYVDADGEILVNNRGDLKIAAGIEALDVSLRIRANSIFGRGIGKDLGADIKGKTDIDAPDIVQSVVDAILGHPAVSNVENIRWDIEEGYYITLKVDVYVQGLSQGFQFLYKINYHDRF